jgi:hypothetical protein
MHVTNEILSKTFDSLKSRKQFKKAMRLATARRKQREGEERKRLREEGRLKIEEMYRTLSLFGQSFGKRNVEPYNVKEPAHMESSVMSGSSGMYCHFLQVRPLTGACTRIGDI